MTSDTSAPIAPPNPQLSICVYAKTEGLCQSLENLLNGDRYRYQQCSTQKDFLDFVESYKESIDCLILQNAETELEVLDLLCDRGVLLPIVIIEPTNSHNTNLSIEPSSATLRHATPEATHYLYHTGEVWLLGTQIEQISTAIERAIAKFLKLAPTSNLPSSAHPHEPTKEQSKQNFLLLQQRRLAEKLQERLGYLGIYYKRNSQDFFRNLSPQNKKALLKELTDDYREIFLNYFTPNYPLNPILDQFVNRAFFADLSVSQILETHMELIDEFAQQLKLEGRSEEILLDYRLVLIDIIAHLCEMYRRSIPREDIPFEVFAPGE
ncbi:circadian clock protein KaiA [Spirulina sp. 06S082]|uniref:circadian clock protein KaiA n=1 Tax=Spirulina sp. 06S082 TaxID=3110248 RepID=UPI002B1FC097|nr:circadian clock protein KaiA [Spirulina sp. 06S082]MEA5467750.1 circadian clock protein KaiA [Spirulina sp. 06S082]